MKEELQGKLVEILTSMQAAAGKASDFAAEQLPDIAQSYITYGRATYTAALVLASLLLIGCWIIAWRVHVAGKAGDRYYDAFFVFFPASIVTLIGSVLFADSFKSAALVWFAPKVWLLKEIAGMLK